MALRFDAWVKGSLRWAVCAAVMAVGVSASAQFVGGMPQQQEDPNDAVHGTDNTSGVYVRDSAVALEKLAHAQRMESLKEWGTSADLYQEILEKYPDRVVPSGVDDHGRIVQYTSVTEAVRQALCKWPAEGLDVYRARYETVAAGLLNTAGPGDLSNLHKIFSLYFVTDTAKTAGIRLMDAYFETGEYAAVAQIGRRLLEWHPNLIGERPKVLYRVAMAEKLCDDAGDAARRLKDLQVKFPKAVGTVRGEDVVLSDSLAEELKSQTKIIRAATTDSWTTFAGDSSRAKISSATGRPGAKLYSIPLMARPVSNDVNVKNQDQSQRQQGAQLGVMPVTDRGELFFQDNLHLYGVDLETGQPLAGWMSTYPGQNGQYQVGGTSISMPAGQQFCVTLTDKYVLSVMGLPDRIAEMNGQGVQEAKLVCLDRATGKEIWKTSVRTLPNEQGALRTLKIGGAPLVVGDNVYILGHGGKGQQFEDSYVLCFDLNNGKFGWSTYLCSAGSDDDTMNQQNGMMIVSDAVSHLAYASGRVYAVSNLGAVAALDAYNGSIIWLDIYRDSNAGAMSNNGFNRFGGFVNVNGQAGAMTQASPWVYNPAIVDDGKVFILPSDKKAVFVYDAGSGKQIQRIEMADLESQINDIGTPDTLLAVLGNSMILGSSGGVRRIDWKAYNRDSNARPIMWETPQVFTSSKSVRGRGFVSENAVYFATNESLACISLTKGNLDFFPKNGFDQAEQAPPDQPGSALQQVTADITASRNLNQRRERTYPRVVKRARHNSYRVKRPGDHGTRHQSPPSITLVNLEKPQVAA